MRKATPPIFPGLAAKMAANGHDARYIASILGRSVDYVRRREREEVEFDLHDIRTLMHLYSCGFDALFGDSTSMV